MKNNLYRRSRRCTHKVVSKKKQSYVRLALFRSSRKMHLTFMADYVDLSSKPIRSFSFKNKKDNYNADVIGPLLNYVEEQGLMGRIVFDRRGFRVKDTSVYKIICILRDNNVIVNNDD